MTAPADLVLRDAEVRTLASDAEVADAVAVRDGRVVRVDRSVEVDHLADVETTVIDCDGATVIPGFVDAHTHLETVGQRRVHADLGRASGRDEAIDRLAEEAETGRGWILGFGYDESEWSTARYLHREELDAVSEDRPVVAMRVDMHAASLNTVALDRLAADLPDGDVETDGGEPTGVVVETAAEAVWEAIEPDREEWRELLAAAVEYATARGVTCVHEKVRNGRVARAYRELDRADALDLRVRLDYWHDFLPALESTGAATNWGSEFVRFGAIKTYTDGSIGARTAKLSEPYEPPESDGEAADGVGANDGQWVVAPDDLSEIVDRATETEFQLAVHAIGDVAIDEAVDALAGAASGADARHRIEHLELPTERHLERMAEAGVVASMQPNFHRWAGDDGLYDARLGPERRRRTNPFRAVLDAGVPLAFGSDCMPLDPLFGIHRAVNAPTPRQRIDVDEAVRAYTVGSARAGFDEDRLGTIEEDKCADLTVLDASPWDCPDRIDEIDVVGTVVDGAVVHDGGFADSIDVDRSEG